MMCFHLIELEIKAITNTARSVKHLDLRIVKDSDEPLRTKLDKGDYFYFPNYATTFQKQLIIELMSLIKFK